MGTYFYKKISFFVHLKSTFQKTSGAASLHPTHWPGTGVGGRRLLLVAPSCSFLSGLQGRRNHSFGLNLSSHYYTTIGQAAALTDVVHKRLPGERGQSVSCSGVQASSTLSLDSFPSTASAPSVLTSSFNFP